MNRFEPGFLLLKIYVIKLQKYCEVQSFLEVNERMKTSLCVINPSMVINLLFVVFSVEDAEYMIMSCPALSPSNELVDSPVTGTLTLRRCFHHDVKLKLNSTSVVG